MADSKDHQPDDHLRRSVRTQIPNLGGELQRAINTLKKLQTITGSMAVEPPSANLLDLRGPSPVEGGAEASPAATIDSKDGVASGGSSRGWRLLTAGEAFGRYQISRLLGKGAMGAVYLAYDPQLERYVALKTPFLGDDPHVIQRFFREARSAAQIRSPYVCAIYEVNNVSGILYLSMAFIEGQTLTQWIREGEHTLDEILEVFSKICQGMQKAHAQNIIHRDLKPENIMIDSDQEPIIMDFGLARRVQDEVQVTAAGGLLGTPAYMSPEQIKGDQKVIGPLSDQYSLGVVFYEMLTGTVPFKGSLMTVLHQVVNDAPPPPSAEQPRLPANSPIEKMCLKMLGKNPLDRYASIGDILSELQVIAPPKQVAAAAPRLSPVRALFRKSAQILATIAGHAPKESAGPALKVKVASPELPNAIQETMALEAAEELGTAPDLPAGTIERRGEED